MSNILVPVDFSPASDNAVRYAVQLAKTLNAGVELLHVYPVPVAAPGIPTEMLLVEEIRRDAEERLNASVAALGNTGTTVVHRVVAGSAGSEAVFHAEKNNFGLVVMGTHGASEGRARWLGSHTLYAVERSRVPVLAVPDNAVFRQWKNVCCATDFDHHEIDAMRELSGWVKKFGGDLTLVHVNNGDQNPNDEAAYRESFIEKVREVTGIQRIRYEYLTTTVDLVMQLREYAVFNDADVLVMLHHLHKGLSRLLHRSLTKEMVKELPMALLSYPVVPLNMEQ